MEYCPNQNDCHWILHRRMSDRRVHVCLERERNNARSVTKWSNLLQFRSLTSNYRRRHLPLWSFHLLLLKFLFRKPLLWSHICAEMKKMPNEHIFFQHFDNWTGTYKSFFVPFVEFVSMDWSSMSMAPNGMTDVDTLLPVFTFASGTAWMLQFIVTPNTNAISAQHNFVSILKIVFFPFSFRTAWTFVTLNLQSSFSSTTKTCVNFAMDLISF